MAGLTTAYTLLRQAKKKANDPAKNPEVRLYEASDRFGGVIRTVRQRGYLLDLGPDSIFTEKPTALNLALELGLAEQLVSTHAERPVAIWWEDHLHRLPAGLTLVAPTRWRPFFNSSLFTFSGKVRAALEPLVPARRGGDDESIASFVRRRFGRQMLERVGDPLLGSIHAGDPERLSIQQTFPKLPRLEQEHGSVLRGALRARRRHGIGDSASVLQDGAVHHGKMAGSAGEDAAPWAGRRGLPPTIASAKFISFRDGMQTLVRALTAAIDAMAPETLHAGQPVVGVAPDEDFELSFADGSSWRADACVLAVPAAVTADLVERFDQELAETLRCIPYSSTAAVHLAYPAGSIRLPFDGTGCLVPHSQGRRIFGCTFVSQKFDGRTSPGSTLLRVFLGGQRQPELMECDDETLIRIAREEVRSLLGIDGELEFARLQRWPRANPQYEVGHAERVRTIDTRLREHPGLFVAGSSCRGVGIPDTIASGQHTARALIEKLARPPDRPAPQDIF